MRAVGGGKGIGSVQQTHLWLSGLPLATAHGPHGPEHDPWCFDAQPLAADDAVDAVLWIDAFGQQPLPLSLAVGPLPLVVLAPPSRLAALPARAAPTVVIAVGTPAVDHGGHLFRAESSVLLPLRALRAASPLPSVAAVLQQLLDAR
jgi:formylmethanofuran dehydrogenase subunit B